MSALLLLLTVEDCHLCAHGREVLETLAGAGLLSWREVDGGSGEGRRLAAAAAPLRPVLFDPNGRVLAYGRLSAKRLRRQLAPLDGQSITAGKRRLRSRISQGGLWSC